MSKEYPCIYNEKGICKFYTTEDITTYCLEGPCRRQKLSNADRIRAMSDEELTKAIGRYMYCGLCPLRSKCNTDEFHTCSEVVMEWLQQPAEE